VLITALEHGLSYKRRQVLMDRLDLCSQTLYRWRKFWREHFPASRCWQILQGQFMPPLEVADLPGAWLGQLAGKDLRTRLCQLLGALVQLTSVCCAGSLRITTDPQKR